MPRAPIRANPRLVFASNGHAIAMAATDARFRRNFDAATLIHADGQPIVFASKATKNPIPERSATTDFIHDAAAAARDSGLRFYLLGAAEAVNADCAERLTKDYKGLSIAGRRNGYFDANEEPAICDAINASGADVLWVGLGVPLEYEFCVRNKHRLNAGWIVTAGGCFNFVTGEYRRAPGWMQGRGTGVALRLWREPKRLFWRYAVTNRARSSLSSRARHPMSAVDTLDARPRYAARTALRHGLTALGPIAVSGAHFAAVRCVPARAAAGAVWSVVVRLRGRAVLPERGRCAARRAAGDRDQERGEGRRSRTLALSQSQSHRLRTCGLHRRRHARARRRAARRLRGVRRHLRRGDEPPAGSRAASPM